MLILHSSRRCAPETLQSNWRLQLEHEQHSGNGLHRDLELSSAEVSMEPDPDGRLVQRPESRRSADLTTFGTKGEISTYLRLDRTSGLQPSDEPSVRIGLRRDLGAGELQVSTKPVSGKLFVLELQLQNSAASRAHSGDSIAG